LALTLFFPYEFQHTCVISNSQETSYVGNSLWGYWN